MDQKSVIYYADVSPLEDRGLYEALYSAAPRHRRGKIDRLRREEDRRLSLGAWSLLSSALAERGVESECEVAYGEKGKPYFRDLPDIRFSLSHSGSIAMCALSDKEIGCDAELIASPRLSVAKRFFAPEEREFLESASPDDISRVFYEIWTLKESFLKAVGTGLSVSPSSFSVITDGEVRLRQDISPTRWHLRTFDISPLYAAAYCTEDGQCAAIAEKYFLTGEMK